MTALGNTLYAPSATLAINQYGDETHLMLVTVETLEDLAVFASRETAAKFAHALNQAKASAYAAGRSGI